VRNETDCHETAEGMSRLGGRSVLSGVLDHLMASSRGLARGLPVVANGSLASAFFFFLTGSTRHRDRRDDTICTHQRSCQIWSGYHVKELSTFSSERHALRYPPKLQRHAHIPTAKPCSYITSITTALVALIGPTSRYYSRYSRRHSTHLMASAVG
jgi:hypothetical protein